MHSIKRENSEESCTLGILAAFIPVRNHFSVGTYIESWRWDLLIHCQRNFPSTF